MPTTESGGSAERQQPADSARAPAGRARPGAADRAPADGHGPRSVDSVRIDGSGDSKRAPRWASALWIATVVAAVIAAAALVALRPLRGAGGGNGVDAASPHHLPSLIADPILRGEYSVDFDGYQSAAVLGRPDRPFVLLDAPGRGRMQDRIVALDRLGAERWQRRFSGQITIENSAPDLLVFEEVDEGHRLHRVDGATGQTRWTIADADAAHFVDDGRVYFESRFDGSNHRHVRVFDYQTGEMLHERLYSRLGDLRSELSMNGLFVANTGTAVQVFDGMLNPVNAPIAVDEPDAISYQDGRILVVKQGQLTQYDESGNVESTATLVGAESFVGLGDLHWFYQSTDGCGSFEMTDDGLTVNWRETAVVCDGPAIANEQVNLVVITSEDASRSGSGESHLVRARTGERLEAAEEFLPAANGFVVLRQGAFRAYSVPTDRSLYGGTLPDDDSAITLLDRGYAITNPPDAAAPARELQVSLYG